MQELLAKGVGWGEMLCVNFEDERLDGFTKDDFNLTLEVHQELYGKPCNFHSNEAAINGKVDRLEGMKENVICGHLIPAGTGQREFEKVIVGSREEYDRILANRKTVTDYTEVE